VESGWVLWRAAMPHDLPHAATFVA
jgi:hypothetical protein